jgi:hypothetical protein
MKPPLVKPDFFVLGAAKSATTSLYYLLAQHPEICMSRDKEPTFFNRPCMTSGPIDYLQLFRATPRTKRVGEASHAYLVCPESAGVIHAFVPEARFLLVLRNPVDRAHSLYHYRALTGHERSPSFECALAEEEREGGLPPYRRESYFRSGLYAEQIERYLQYFDRRRFLFLTFEELTEDGLKTMKRVYEFLEVDASFVPKLEKHNEGLSVRSPRLQFFYTQRLVPALRLLRGIPVLHHFGSWGERRAERLMRRNVRPMPRALAAETRRRLEAAYADNLRRVEQLTGLNLSAWIPGRQGNVESLNAA